VRPLLIAAAILVACAGLLYLLFMSPYAFTILDKYGPSESIRESRERGVYLFRYKVLNPDHYINDSTELHIREAWIERPWRVGTFYHQTIQDYDGTFLLCVIDSTIRDSKSIKHAPKLHVNGRYFGGFGYSEYQKLFVSSYQYGYGPPPDRYDFPIVIGDFKKPDTVGTLHLVFEDGRPDTPR
jgi:hypothetical protein